MTQNNITARENGEVRLRTAGSRLALLRSEVKYMDKAFTPLLAKGSRRLTELQRERERDAE